MRQLCSLRSACFSVVSALALVNCGPGGAEPSASQGTDESVVSSGLTVPPDEAGIKYRGLRVLMDNGYTIAERRGDELQMVHSNEVNVAAAELATYEFANGLDFCVPNTLRLIKEDPNKGRALEIYVATCLDNSGANGVKLVENFPLSWRRLGATGPFVDNRRGSFAYNGDGRNFAAITNNETRKELTHRRLKGFNSKVTLEAPANETPSNQAWMLAFFAECNSGNGQCMYFE